MTERNNGGTPQPFSSDIATDLASGRLVELAELYALDAVSGEEHEAIDKYLSSAPQDERHIFNQRVRQTREALALSFTAEEEPPSDLLDRITAQLPSQRPVRESTASLPDELGAARERREERRLPSAMRTWLVGVAAAAAIALGGVGIGAYVANQNDPVNQVLQAQDVRKASVGVAGGGTANIAISAGRDAVVVMMEGVPAPPEGKVYQMWLIPKDGSAPVSKGLMDAEALSKPAVVTDIRSAAALGITVEPVGGSTSPTQPTVAEAPLDA
jgi:anti-sigma-K factor RskA